MEGDRDLLGRLRELGKELEGVGARAILNYVIFEFSVGGPSQDVLNEAVSMALKEVEELRRVIEALEQIKALL